MVVLTVLNRGSSVASFPKRDMVSKGFDLST